MELSPQSQPSPHPPKPKTLSSTGPVQGMVIEESSPPNGHMHSVTGFRLIAICIAYVVSFTLIALDQTILSTALPTIASHFQAVSDLTWIASGYFLPQAGLTLLAGKVLVSAPVKGVFLASIFTFELGSLISALAPSVVALIIGRVISGVGAAGLWVSILTSVAQITTLKQRPLLLSMFGVVFAISCVVGPLLGGVFSDRVSWRWCFWINLPFGGLALILVAWLLPNFGSPQSTTALNCTAWLHFDYVGAALSLSVVISLFLPLQWGGNEKKWSDPDVIVLLVLFAFLLIIFLAWEYRQGWNAILPISIVISGNMPGACLEAFFVNMCFAIATYYLPLFYQVKGHSAEKSGIDILPFMISLILSSFAAGAIIRGTGYVWPFLFIAPMLAAVGSGLLHTISPTSTRSATLIGYQILAGAGLGPSIQNTLVVAQAQYNNQPSLLPQATSLITFMQRVGSSIGLAASGAIFTGLLSSKLDQYASELSPSLREAVRESVTAIFTLPLVSQPSVIHAYAVAVTSVFLVCLASVALGSLSCLLISPRKMILTPI